MSEGTWTAIGAVAMALINMVGSVLLAWIRAKYPNSSISTNNHDITMTKKEKHNGGPVA